MSASGKPFPWQVWALSLAVLGILVLLMFGMVQCSEGQTIQQPPAPQQPQVYAIPRPVYFPWVRYNVLGWPPPYMYVQAYGEPYQATVQPVVPYYGGRR